MGYMEALRQQASVDCIITERGRSWSIADLIIQPGQQMTDTCHISSADCMLMCSNMAGTASLNKFHKKQHCRLRQLPELP